MFIVLQPLPAPAEAVLGQSQLSPSFRRALGGREIQVVTGSASAPWPEHPGPNDGQESRRIPVRVKETPPPAAVAGISHFRSKGRDNLKLPQLLEILWHMKSIGISPALSSTGI